MGYFYGRQGDPNGNDSINANLNGYNSRAEREREDMLRSGRYRIALVRQSTPEVCAKYGATTRNVNGVSRIVSVFECNVTYIQRSGSVLRFHCIGTDNLGNRIDGVYHYYQTPDGQNKRDTFILSATRIGD